MREDIVDMTATIEVSGLPALTKYEEPVEFIKHVSMKIQEPGKIDN